MSLNSETKSMQKQINMNEMSTEGLMFREKGTKIEHDFK
jgi:hypothetical protein